MKKFLAMALGCTIISLSLCGCSGGGNVGTYDNGTYQNGTYGSSGNYNNGTTRNTANNATTNTTNGVGIGGGVSGSISGGVGMDNIWNDMQSELGDNIPSAQILSDDSLEDIYGIDIEDLQEHKVYISDDDNKPDEIFLAKVKTGEMSNVETAVRNRQKVLGEKWKDKEVSEKEKVSDYRLITNGNYILYVVSEKADAIVDIFNSYTKDEKVEQ